MIIKYSEDIILDDWNDRPPFSYSRSYKSRGLTFSVVYIDLIDIDEFIKDTTKTQIENQYTVKFYGSLKFMNNLFGNEIIKDDIENIKKSVDTFLIKMSKLKHFQ
jgi:hypothetical protein